MSFPPTMDNRLAACPRLADTINVYTRSLEFPIVEHIYVRGKEARPSLCKKKYTGVKTFILSGQIDTSFHMHVYNVVIASL